ncbi:DUF642 domain-containing protein [Allopontixanthobacter sediminis]|uniref:DUF642 domain-containing protein n=1 Tax=Allopontixanthobacter sediminis TaxID=1689985 RepID=A0A845BAH1_9SPHN|nr:DUF642 domain-containing protein [Allopontixanthobacter sediminis]MXP44589.1 DUF642 domain-containing protein [Allopontixanthobacter sediminis]
MIKPLLIAATLAATASPASAAELITNGSFENPEITDPCCSTVPTASLPGWTIGSGNVNVVNGTFASAAGNLALDGTQYLDLIGEGGVGSLSQTFGTIAGQLYLFKFAYSHNIFSGLPSASASYSVDGLSGIITHSTGSNANLDWQMFSGTFVATGSSATLNFTNLLGGANDGILLDAVSVSAVPEPSTWLLLVFGIGAIGFAMRRQKRARTRVSYAF